MQEADLNNKLEITIRNTKMVDLVDLTQSLFGISEQYKAYIKNDSKNSCIGNLYIKEIRKGSIVIELVAQTLPYIALFSTSAPIADWVRQLQQTLDWLKGECAIKPVHVTKKDLEQIRGIVRPIAKDHGSQMNLNVTDNTHNHCTVNYNINYNDAKKIESEATKQIAKIEVEDEHIYRKCLMTWYQSRLDKKAKTGDMATIEAITQKPLKLIFLNDQDKESMYNAGNQFDKPWHELAFTVDVEVQSILGQPKRYKIIKYYAEETFEID